MVAFQEGDEQCFSEIVRRYKDPLTNFAFRILGNRTECDDVVQDTFLRVYRSRQTYKPVATGAVSIWEQVTTESDCRHWRVDFKLPSDDTLRFERFSTLLTIHDVAAMLDDLDFDETEPFQLSAERPGFGVIIAQKRG